MDKSRMGKLLGTSHQQPKAVSQASLITSDYTEQQKKMLEAFRAKAPGDFKDALVKWLRNFVNKYLRQDRIYNRFQKSLFMITWND